MMKHKLWIMTAMGLLLSQRVHAHPEVSPLSTLCMPGVAICAVQVLLSVTERTACDKRGTADPLEKRASGPTGTGIEQPCKPAPVKPLE
jgi:hypothetical protein